MNSEDKVIELIRRNNGILKTKDVVLNDLDKMSLTRLVEKGKLERIEKGLYIESSKLEDEYYNFQYRCPKAIFSHETALYFHDLTDRTPNILMVTIPSGYSSRLLKDNRYKFSYIKDSLYELGKTKVKTPYGNEVFCYDIERTIVDIIRDKKKIEDYQFVDALKQYAKIKVKDIAKLYEYAEKFNIKEEVKKYMEILS